MLHFRLGNRRNGIYIDVGYFMLLVEPNRKKAGAEPGLFRNGVGIEKSGRSMRFRGIKLWEKTVVCCDGIGERVQSLVHLDPGKH